MKKLGLILAALLATVAIAPSVSAASIDLSRYRSETLAETFAEEGLSYDFANSNYSDTGDKTIIYVFRKDGCLNCKNFYTFIMNQLLPQYGSNFKVISYELSNNPINFTLLGQMADFYNQRPDNDVYGTPVVVVGDTMTMGPDSITSERKQEIVDLVAAETKYNVVDEIADGINNVNDSMKTTFAKDGVTLVTEKPLYRSYSLRVSPSNLSNLGLHGYDYVAAYDIDMLNNGNIVPALNTNLTISIPVSKQYKSYKVAYVDGGQIEEVLDASYQNGIVIFKTTHLSKYAIYGSNDEVVAKKTPTAPNSAAKVMSDASTATVSFLPAVILAFAFFYRKWNRR